MKKFLIIPFLVVATLLLIGATATMTTYRGRFIGTNNVFYSEGGTNTIIVTGAGTTADNGTYIFAGTTNISGTPTPQWTNTANNHRWVLFDGQEINLTTWSIGRDADLIVFGQDYYTEEVDFTGVEWGLVNGVAPSPSVTFGSSALVVNGPLIGSALSLTNFPPLTAQGSAAALSNFPAVSMSLSNLDALSWVNVQKGLSLGGTYSNYNVPGGMINTMSKWRAGKSIWIARFAGGWGGSQDPGILDWGTRMLTNYFGPVVGTAGIHYPYWRIVSTSGSGQQSTTEHSGFFYPAFGQLFLQNDSITFGTDNLAGKVPVRGNVGFVIYPLGTNCGHIKIETNMNGGSFSAVQGGSSIDCTAAADYSCAIKWFTNGIVGDMQIKISQLDAGATRTASTLARSGTTATFTTAADHQLKTGDQVTVSGATPSAFNVTAVITVTGSKTFTYAVASGSGSASGTCVATLNFNSAAILTGVMDTTRQGIMIWHSLGSGSDLMDDITLTNIPFRNAIYSNIQPDLALCSQLSILDGQSGGDDNSAGATFTNVTAWIDMWVTNANMASDFFWISSPYEANSGSPRVKANFYAYTNIVGASQGRVRGMGNVGFIDNCSPWGTLEDRVARGWQSLGNVAHMSKEFITNAYDPYWLNILCPNVINQTKMFDGASLTNVTRTRVCVAGTPPFNATASYLSFGGTVFSGTETAVSMVASELPAATVVISNTVVSFGNLGGGTNAFVTLFTNGAASSYSNSVNGAGAATTMTISGSLTINAASCKLSWRFLGNNASANAGNVGISSTLYEKTR